MERKLEPTAENIDIITFDDSDKDHGLEAFLLFCLGKRVIGMKTLEDTTDDDGNSVNSDQVRRILFTLRDDDKNEDTCAMIDVDDSAEPMGLHKVIVKI